MNLIKKANENHFGIFAVLMAAAAGYLAYFTGNGFSEVISNSITHTAIYLASATGFMTLFGTTGLDVKREIVDKHNTSLAILLGCIMVGLGLAIGSGI